MKKNPTVEVFITEHSKREIVEINFGQRIEVLSRQESMELAEAIIKAFVSDEDCCQHDWSFPPKVCPVCNKRVKIRATFIDELLDDTSEAERMKKIGAMQAQVAYYQNSAEHSVHLTAFGARLRARLANLLFDMSTYLSQSGGR